MSQPAAPHDTGSPDASSPGEAPQPSSFGKFIQTYSSFLSSFVIGVAGLIATSTYQYSQSRVARQQAEAQQKIAETQAENNWKIERAKILSQNLNVLAAQNGGNIEQRYGVLLSLTRGAILDSELAVSYALELGKDNPDYMRIVLTNTTDKEYRRLENAFVVTCDQRFGASRAVPLCQTDKLAERSNALAALISDDAEIALTTGKSGPLGLLSDDREVEANLLKLLWIFTPLLDDLYDRRQWDSIRKFESLSTGARLVSALMLLSTQNGDLISAGEAAQVERFQGERRDWLARHLTSSACEAECKGKVASILLTGLSRAHGLFDVPLRALLQRPRIEVVAAVNRLNRRLLYCQVAGADEAALRDQVLVPVLSQQVKEARPDNALIEDLVSLLSVMPEPPVPQAEAAGVAPRPSPAREQMGALVQALQRGDGRYARLLSERRTATRRLRQNPPPAQKKSNFCNVAESADGDEGEDGE